MLTEPRAPAEEDVARVFFVVDMDGGKPLPEVDGRREATTWVFDTGASEPVADPKQLPDCALEPLLGSRAGQEYAGVGPGQDIKNLGQMKARRVLPNGFECDVSFQGANVRKPLLAVSSVADKGNPFGFDMESEGGGCVIPVGSPELPEIRRLIRTAAGEDLVGPREGHLPIAQLVRR